MMNNDIKISLMNSFVEKIRCEMHYAIHYWNEYVDLNSKLPSWEYRFAGQFEEIVAKRNESMKYLDKAINLSEALALALSELDNKEKEN